MSQHLTDRAPMPTAVTVQSDADIAQQQRLSEIPGLEVDCGLSALRGSVPKYKKLLGLFADRYDSFPEKIAELASAGELTGMETLVHTLRGAAAILGATDVSESASAVLSALRTKSQVGLVHELSVALARKLANLIDEIRRLPQ